MANLDEYYKGTISHLEERLYSFDPKAREVYNLIRGLETNIPIEVIENSKTSESVVKIPQLAYDLNGLIALVFDKDASVTDLIQFSITYSDKLVKAKEIEQIIKSFYPGFSKGLSSAFYKLKEQDIIDTFNPTISESNPEGSNHSVYYGLKKWFIGKNEVNPEYISKDLQDLIDIL